MRRRVWAAMCALLLWGLVLPATGKTKSSNHLSANTFSLPAWAQSANSTAVGCDREAYHAAVARKGFITKNLRSDLQAIFTLAVWKTKADFQV